MQRFSVPRRLALVGAIAFGAFALAGVLAAAGGTGTQAAKADAYTAPLCVQHSTLCTEANDRWTWNNYNYISGHDEPSLLFYSNKKGSGNSNEYQLTLPTDPAAPPSDTTPASTWNFQLHPAFWFGMAMCDDQSAPNPGVACPPDSDKNIKTSTDSSSPNYLGLTPGSAFMEMQFYPPGWGPISCTDGEGNTDGKWCSALTIDSDPVNQNTGTPNNAACQDSQGPEPVNWAAITKSGIPAAPANPFTPFGEQAVVTDDTLQYNNGDKLVVDMHDTKAGFQVVIKDLTTGESGFMTASTANGFGHALFQPTAHSCTFRPYAFHPMYSTSSPTRACCGRRTPTTSPSRTRSATSSTATRSRTSGARLLIRIPPIRTRRSTTTSRASRLRSSIPPERRSAARSTGASNRTTTSTAPSTKREPGPEAAPAL